MPGSRKFSLYFHENLSRNLLSLLDFYVNYKESIVLPDILSKCSSESYKQRKVCWLGRRVPFNLRCSTSVAWHKYYTVSKLMKTSLYAQARQLPLLKAQSSVWNRLVFLNNYLMLLHKLNEILFRANWTWISDRLRHLVFWKPYLWVKILKNMQNASLENLSTTIRNLYLEALGINLNNH